MPHKQIISRGKIEIVKRRKFPVSKGGKGSVEMLNVDTGKEYFDAEKQFLSICWLSLRSAATEVSQNLINIGQKFSAKKSNFSKRKNIL